MPAGKDVKSPEPDLGEPVIPDLDPPDSTHQPVGRIIHDERGNAVWKWYGDLSSTGSGSGILQHLDPGDLEVENQGDRFVTPQGNMPRAPDPGGGYDPYNQTRSGNCPGVSRKGSRTKR